jgi:DNA topoisomerase-2
MSNESEISTKYQMKSDKQHILDNPNMYIGSTQSIDVEMYVFDDETKKIVEKKIDMVPALYKLFDEAIINCRDHSVRMEQVIANASSSQSIGGGETKEEEEKIYPVTNIEVEVKEDGTIVMLNDGNGIDIIKHPEHDIWIPEMIFGHLRTSTNYDKNEKKIVGGVNGLGIKLIFIWSVFGEIETVDHIRKLKYTQTFENNLEVKGTPKIVACKTKPYTRITFKPDYERLGLSGLTPDMISLFQKRVYDIAAVTKKNVKVKFNRSLLPVKSFLQYIQYYFGGDEKVGVVYEEFGERWELGVALSTTGEFQQVSFVNGIHTSKGGRHVDYILNSIIRRLVDYIEKKKKIRVQMATIKEQLHLFVRCDIENPSFDSQTKDSMTSTMSKFGSLCHITDKFIDKIIKLGVVEHACAVNDLKEAKNAKKSDGSKTKHIRGIPKLVDANLAGTAQSHKCTLILCEGDSAKAGVISGLSSEDKNVIGVYPLKGKLLNVRGENITKISENKEICEIKKIIGLENNKTYTEEVINSQLRYGKVLILTDADVDGSHIKGLIINLFHSEWNTLIDANFIGFMNTPILKARNKKQEALFYNEREYELWKDSMGDDVKSWSIKYYKGLGTSTSVEFKEYFKSKKMVWFQQSEVCNDAIDMVFNKKRSNDRKRWLENYDRTNYANNTLEKITYSEFIDKELIHFSKYDCDRSIPNLMDGLKTSQRKILYSAFKRNLTSEIKVAQFSGYVSEHSGYHHGEMSLNGAIIGMAQNFVGSNNINLLSPLGQFGTRIGGGSDHASERYIFTKLEQITRKLYPKEDDNILEYLNDDGTLVEPVWYAPIIPMVLVNGACGIGTGFSTQILCYNPFDVINYIRNKLNDVTSSASFEFMPYYRGFTGVITSISPSAKKGGGDGMKFLVKGIYSKKNENAIYVTELPVGTWIDQFKELLEKLCATTDKDGKKINPYIKNYEENCTDKTVHFTITFMKDRLAELEAIPPENGIDGVEKLLKLYSIETTSNMHLFDSQDKLKKYGTVEEIIDDYYGVRLEMYAKRKEYMIKILQKELLFLRNKVSYISSTIQGKIDLRNKKSVVVTQMMEEMGFDKIDDNYNYLIKLPMDSVTEENVEKLIKQHSDKSGELETLLDTEITSMWSKELTELLKIYQTTQR